MGRYRLRQSDLCLDRGLQPPSRRTATFELPRTIRESMDLSEHLQTALAASYRVERELGGGGMSRVFVATEIALGRRVVIKVLPPELAAGLSSDRFHREIQLAASLQHPHIVPLLAAGKLGSGEAGRTESGE